MEELQTELISLKICVDLKKIYIVFLSNWWDKVHIKRKSHYHAEVSTDEEVEFEGDNGTNDDISSTATSMTSRSDYEFIKNPTTGYPEKVQILEILPGQCLRIILKKNIEKLGKLIQKQSTYDETCKISPDTYYILVEKADSFAVGVKIASGSTGNTDFRAINIKFFGSDEEYTVSKSKAYSIDYYVEKYKLIRIAKLADGLIPRDRETNETLSNAKQCAIEFIKQNTDAKIWFQKTEINEKSRTNMEFVIEKYYAETTDCLWSKKDFEKLCDMKKYMVLRIGFYLKDIKDLNDKFKQLVCVSWDDKEIEHEITVKAEVVKMLTEKNYLKIFIQQYFKATNGGFQDSKTSQSIDMKKFLKQKIRDQNNTG